MRSGASTPPVSTRRRSAKQVPPSRSSSCSRRIRPRPRGARCWRLTGASRRFSPRSTTRRCRRPSGRRWSARSPRRSRSSGRPTRSARSGRGSSTRSARASGSSSRASGTPCRSWRGILAARLPGATGRSGFGTWIGGDLDGNPHAGPDTIEDALERARALAIELYRREIRELGAAWGMSTTVLGDIAELGRRGRAVPCAARRDLGSPRRRRLSRRRGPPARSRRVGCDPAGAPRRPDRRRRARRRARAGARLRAPSREARCPRARLRRPLPDDRLRATLAAAARAQRRHGPGALDRLIVSMTHDAADVLEAERLAEEAGASVRGVPLLETIDDLRRAPELVGSFSTAARGARWR